MTEFFQPLLDTLRELMPILVTMFGLLAIFKLIDQLNNP